jgi:hypothetical protein
MEGSDGVDLLVAVVMAEGDWTFDLVQTSIVNAKYPKI